VKRPPQIRLRTLFAITLCLAVGLTVGARGNFDRSSVNAFGSWAPTFNWHYTVLATASAAIIIGLITQAIQLLHSASPTEPGERSLAFARRFAISWRLATAAIIALCLAVALLLSQHLIELPDTETYLTYEVFPYAWWTCCIAVVLLASLTRLAPQRMGAKTVGPSSVIAWLITGLALLLIMPNIGLITYLVHIATQSIENAQPRIYHREGGFLGESSGFRLFWVATVVVALAFVALVCLISAGRDRQKSAVAPYVAIFIATLTPAAAYCIWYYWFGLPRISLDMADGGLASNYLEVIAGIGMAVLLITAGAYRISTLPPTAATQAHADTPQIAVAFYVYCCSQLPQHFSSKNPFAPTCRCRTFSGRN
jgi:hypothetical protein